jgi:hypothetical protein
MRIVELRETTDKDGYMDLRVPTSLPRQEVDVVVVVQPAQPAVCHDNSYDFSRFSGRLKWQGDALSEQRALRSEW